MESKYKENGLSPQEKLVCRQEDIKLGFVWEQDTTSGTGEKKLLICRFPTGSKEDRYYIFFFCFLQGGRCQSLRMDDG
jgi:hypothetical protein